MIARSAAGAMICSAFVQTLVPNAWSEGSQWLYVDLLLALILSLTGTEQEVAFLVGLLLPFVAVEPAPYDVLVGVLLVVRWTSPTLIAWLRKPSPVMLRLEDWFLVAFVVGSIISTYVNRGNYFFVAVTMYLLSSYVAFRCLGPSVGKALVAGYVSGALFEYLSVSVWRLLNEPFLSKVMFGWRVKGTFKDPNVYGAFFIPLLLGSVDALICGNWANKATRRSVILFVLATISAHAILTSYSRGAVVATAVGVLILVFMRLRNGPSVLYKTITLSVVIPIIAFSLETAVISAQNFLYEKNSDVATQVQDRVGLKPYDNRRFGVQLAALALAPSHPLGIGPGRILDRFNYDAHSLFIRVLVENGWIAFVGMLGWIGQVLFRLLVEPNEGTIGVHSPALVAAISAFCVDSLVISTLHWRHFWLLFAAATVAVGLVRGANGMRAEHCSGGDKV